MSYSISPVQGIADVSHLWANMFSTDSLATVISPGYITPGAGGVSFNNSTVIKGFYNGNISTGVGTFGIFTCSISGGVITLTEWINPADVVTPTTTGNIAVFGNTNGQITQNANPAVNLGNIQAGASGSAGALVSFPSAESKGSLIVAGVANAGDTNTTLSNAAMGQASVISITDPGAATANLIPVASTIAVPAGTTNTLILLKNTQSTFTALATAGKVNVVTASGADRYQIIGLYLNGGGVNFSGGGGDRLLALTDGTTVYSVIPAATLQALVNATWGATDIPFPASAAINALTAAGANLYFQYSGGTTDYTAGAVIITVELAKLA